MHKFEQGFDDSRAAFRTMVNQEVTIILLDAESNIETTANCRDISDTAIALELTHPVDIGTLLTLALDSDDQLSMPLTDCKGRVLRCEQESKELFLLAVEIIDSE
ncbi:hypothetical protein A9Q98_13205 [Thalassotalea sp. 42_200_T64]|mgnify:CR=1 FL=1|nr:hypothetical protein A9Q98_13205 [Thalassotalea sp. 42_200_T64]